MSILRLREADGDTLTVSLVSGSVYIEITNYDDTREWIKSSTGGFTIDKEQMKELALVLLKLSAGID